MDCSDLRAKYRRRRKAVKMSGNKMTWPPEREPALRTGRTRIWGPDQTTNRPMADWGKHLDRHEVLLQQIGADEWDR